MAVSHSRDECPSLVEEEPFLFSPGDLDLPGWMG